MGQGAVDAGLADGVGDLRTALDRARARAAEERPRGGQTLSVVDGLIGARGSSSNQHEVRSPVATAPETKTLVAEAAALERKPFAAIIFSAEAEGREKLAEHLAFQGELSAADAIAVLAKAPQVNTPSRAPLRLVPRPAIGQDAPPGEPANEWKPALWPPRPCWRGPVGCAAHGRRARHRRRHRQEAVSVAVMISGRLHAPPTTRTTAAGVVFTTAKVRVANGNAIEWFDVAAFGEAARAELDLLGEGDAVAITGSLRLEVYDWEGETRISRQVTAERVMALKSTATRRRAAEVVQ